MTVAPHDVKVFIEQCVRGEPEARLVFQETYGALIYSFPIRQFRLLEEDTGDVYLYVFEKERVFKRLRSFEGRNQIQFETYLSYYVLRDLFFEWSRTVDKAVTVSLETPIDPADAGGGQTRTLQDVLEAETPTPEAAMIGADTATEVDDIVAELDEEKWLTLKLLALGSIEFTPEACKPYPVSRRAVLVKR